MRIKYNIVDIYLYNIVDIYLYNIVDIYLYNIVDIYLYNIVNIYLYNIVDIYLYNIVHIYLHNIVHIYLYYIHFYHALVLFEQSKSSWLWSYGRWIYNYICNQCLSPLTLWVLIPPRRGVHDSILCDKVCQWLATSRWFSPGTPVDFQSNRT